MLPTPKARKYPYSNPWLVLGDILFFHFLVLFLFFFFLGGD